jgi:hypothetical protein
MILAPLIVFLMLLTVSPVLACPTHWQKVSAWNTTTGFGSPPAVAPKYSWTTPSGITIDIGSQTNIVGQLGIGSNTYALYSHSVSNLVFNSKTGVADRYSDAIWYVTPLATGPLEGAPDGFSGNVQIVYNGVTTINSLGVPNPPYSSYSVQVMMQGFGKFAGDTLMLSFSGPAVLPPPPWTGYCLIPK